MNEAEKLSLATELIENKIAKTMNLLEKDNSKQNEEKYKKLIETRDKIYKRNIDEIEKIINESRM